MDGVKFERKASLRPPPVGRYAGCCGDGDSRAVAASNASGRRFKRRWLKRILWSVCVVFCVLAVLCMIGSMSEEVFGIVFLSVFFACGLLALVDVSSLVRYLGWGCYRKSLHHSVRRVVFVKVFGGVSYVGVVVKGRGGDAYPDWSANFLITKRVDDADECRRIVERLPLESWSRITSVLGDGEGGERFRHVTYYPCFRVYYLGTSQDFAKWERS